MSERDISPEALEAAFRRLRQEVSLRVQAPPVATLIKKSRARSRRRLLVAATASAAAVLATVFLLLPDDASTPAPVGPVSVELSAPLVNGEPAAVAPGPVMTAGASAQVDVTAANTGERTLTDVAASADGSDLTCLVTTLDPGEATTCSTSVVPLEGPQQLAVDVTADDPDAETVTDRITVFMRGTPPPRPAVAISDPMMDGESAGAAQRPSVPTDQDVRVEGRRHQQWRAPSGGPDRPHDRGRSGAVLRCDQDSRRRRRHVLGRRSTRRRPGGDCRPGDRRRPGRQCRP